MLTELAHAQGHADCLAKFAIDAKAFQRLEEMYGHLPGEQFNKHVQQLAAQESQHGPKIVDPLGVLQTPATSSANPTAVGSSGRAKPGVSRNVSLNREQLQGMSSDDVHRTLTGKFPAPPMTEAHTNPGVLPSSLMGATVPQASVRPTAPPTAGTVPGRINPLLQGPKLRM